MASEALIKLWSITSWEEYQNDWLSSVGPFTDLSEYQESLGFTSPEDFFTKQAIAAQILANDKIGNILERVYSTKDLTISVRQQLKKFTYQAIDFVRANDLIIVEDVRQQQTTINNQRIDSGLVNIDRVEGLVGAAAWRSFTLAGLEKLYFSWAQTQDLPHLLDPTRYYDKDEVDYELSLVDDQIQQQQTFIDKKLKEFNAEMEKELDEFKVEIKTNLINDPDFIDKTSEQVNDSAATKDYVTQAIENSKLWDKNLDNTISLINNSDVVIQDGDFKTSLGSGGLVVKNSRVDNKGVKIDGASIKGLLTEYVLNERDAANKGYVDNAVASAKGIQIQTQTFEFVADDDTSMTVNLKDVDFSFEDIIAFQIIQPDSNMRTKIDLCGLSLFVSPKENSNFIFQIPANVWANVPAPNPFAFLLIYVTGIESSMLFTLQFANIDGSLLTNEQISQNGLSPSLTLLTKTKGD